ncbi:MAG: septum formation protein Maf [Deltaproteobacteria bacterium]|nr:septum formation protein Maf [Deltaproteobacteria bacterium]
MGAHKFILASASPRRKVLLEKAGYDFRVVVSGVDESLFSTESVTSIEHTKQLALAKAKDVAKRNPTELVMGADTVVDFNGKIIGKPDDANHAEEITRMLFSEPHDVITGVAVVRVCGGIEMVEAAVTKVFPKQLTEEQILYHIKNGKWEGKAGAYGIQETGDEFVERIDGSFTNVIGLPMELVAKMLAKATA